MATSKQLLAGFLCFVMSAWPAIADPQAGNQHAGQINAMIPAVTRNAQKATVQEDLEWNDLLQTQHSGRVRAGLVDGSILSVGSNSELRIVQHDAASQQTSLQMDFGKVRSQVVKITKPGGKFQMTTPNAVIGVIGTDFYVEYAANRTTVICYEGQVSVTPLGNATVATNTGQGNAAGQILVNAGQMVVITTTVPPGGFHQTDAPPNVRQAGLLSTDVPEKPVGYHASHTIRNIFIASAIATGIAIGVTVATHPSSQGCVPGKASPSCQ